MIRLMNSAMMPKAGVYRIDEISQERFCEILRENKVDSYIGYQQTCDYIEKISGVKVAMSRGKTVLEIGDKILIIKLKYRVNPLEKGKEVAEDFEFFICDYRDR